MKFFSFTGMFFPYDDRLLRCHPAGYAYFDTPELFPTIRCKDWRMKCKWKCTECNETYFISNSFFLKWYRFPKKLVSISNQCRKSGKCAIHNKPLLGRKWHRYIGPFIPMHIHRPIRAGLLYGVDHMELLSLIAHLLIPDFSGPEDESIQQREERARLHIAVVSGYTVPELADNCFWGDVIVSTKKRQPKRKRNDQGVNDHQ
jgi:hypothetical protein